MYNYKIRCGAIEMGTTYQLVHEEEFTKKELMDIVEDCIFEAIEYTADVGDDWMDGDNELPVPPHVFHDGAHIYECMTSTTFKKALDDRGFKPLENTAEAVCSNRPATQYTETEWAKGDEELILKNLDKRCREAGIEVQEINGDNELVILEEDHG